MEDTTRLYLAAYIVHSLQKVSKIMLVCEDPRGVVARKLLRCGVISKLINPYCTFSQRLLDESISISKFNMLKRMISLFFPV